ncbi:hypothetical protein MHYP_G00354710 [Metynnis hypsauchen]
MPCPVLKGHKTQRPHQTGREKMPAELEESHKQALQKSEHKIQAKETKEEDMLRHRLQSIHKDRPSMKDSTRDSCDLKNTEALNQTRALARINDSHWAFE